ncbi:SGNH/GDSL hydrolase family protein [Vibrio ouci]|uniref:SGNH/GDSL hydrolase family protein n=1 Tax=Vibrio ouci TaxID=2499078 RepID=A0A4Y8WA06_9VIBR|nr:SGNH/GDSL hydrolase family protein [Vibrio ouci]TFH89486.1 hypothetical protein ELS82_21920 [Vibrio ouci]
MKKVDNLIIFGDSLSDIGNKRSTAEGVFARIFGMMRTNEVGRFSDSKNWTDFIWEWSGGTSMFQKDASTTRDITKLHLSLNDKNRDKETFSYANYAEGGAMGASDRSKIGLGTFKEQKERFLKDAKKQNIKDQTNVFLIWFGLNDLVTNGRNENKMVPVADEICDLCDQLLKEYPNSYFLIANIPNPQTAVRYVGKTEEKEVIAFNDGALQFSVALAERINQRPHAHLVDIRTPTDDIDENIEKYGLVKGAQPKGEKVRYDGEQANKHYSTTSDKAHPSEAIYQLMANVWAKEIVLFLLSHELELGNLAQSGESEFIVRN